MYNEEMKDEIMVTRRATYKAEEAVSNLEKDKGRQDLFIDRLMEEASGGKQKSKARALRPIWKGTPLITQT